MKQTLLLALACHLLVAAPAQSPPGFKWVKTITFVIPNSGAEFFDFCTDPTGNSYVFGIFKGTLNFGGNVTLQAQGAKEAYLVAKYAPNGVLNWVHKITAPDGGFIYGVDENPCGISADTSGNVYISGQLTNTALNFGDGVLLQRSCSGNCSDFFLAKYNAAGQAQWVTSSAGSANTYQTGTRLVVGKDGSVFVAGNYTGQTINIGNVLTYNNLEPDGLYMARFLADGQPVSAWFFSNGNGYAQLDHLAVSRQNNLFATGMYDGGTMDFGNGVNLETFGGNNASNFFVAEYNDQGVAQSAYNLNSETYLDVLDIAADTAGQPYVVVDFNTGLNHGNTGISTSVADTYTATLLHLTDSVFQVIVEVQYDSAAYPIGNVAVDRYNRFFASGSFGDIQLDVDTAVLEHVNCDEILLFSGTSDTPPLEWVRSAGGDGCEGILTYYFGRALSTDQTGNLYAVGSFHSSLNLDLFSKNGDGLFITSLGTGIVGTHDPLDIDPVRIVPNPSRGDFKVEWTDFSGPVHLILYDAQGRVCFQRVVSQNADLDFNLHLPTGLYTLEWLTRNQIGQQKVVIAN